MSLLSRLLSAAPDLALGAAFLVTWFDPTRLGEGLVRYAAVTMMLEFIVIHSSAFMGVALWAPLAKGKKIPIVLGLGALYSVFTLGLGLTMGEWWPTWAFWGLTLNRMTNALLDPGKASDRLLTDWVFSVFYYIVFMFGALLLPVPMLGITPEVAQAVNIGGTMRPHQLMAAGALYFLAQGLTELFGAASGKVALVSSTPADPT